MNCTNVLWTGTIWKECWTIGPVEGRPNPEEEDGLSITLDRHGDGACSPCGEWFAGCRVMRAWPFGFCLSSFVASDGRFWMGSLAEVDKVSVGASQPGPRPGLALVEQKFALENFPADDLPPTVAQLTRLDLELVARLKESFALTEGLRQRVADGYSVHVALVGSCEDGTPGAFDDWWTPYEARSLSWVGKSKGPLARVGTALVIARYDPETCERRV